MTTTITTGALTSAMRAPTMIPSPPRGVWEIGPIPIRAYALCIIIGILVACWWGNRRLVARGGRPGTILDLAVWAVPFGIIGGRLYHVVSDPELYFGDSSFISRGHWNPWGVFAIWNGGLGIWGAIALGALGVFLGCRRYRIPFGAAADAMAPGIVLAQGVGRIGNYFNQELFGKPTDVPWALGVYLRTPGGESVTNPQQLCQQYNGEFPTEWVKSSSDFLCGTYHPTFLYELIWDVLIAVLVVWADRYFRLGHGRVLAAYVAGYTFGRGWIEMMRIDHANHILGLRLNVFVSVIVFVAAVVFLVLTRHRTREDPAMVYGISPDDRDSDPGDDADLDDDATACQSAATASENTAADPGDEHGSTAG